MDPLIAYIEKERSKGFSEELIQQKLLHAGYTMQEVHTAFQEYEQRQPYHRFIGKIVDQEAHHKWLIAVAGIFLLILLTGILVSLFSSPFSSEIWGTLFEGKETVYVEPQTEHDCSLYTHRDKERCLLKVAALLDDTSLCMNMTSKVMTYECKTAVWEKNHCNFLILTNQSTAGC